MADRVSACCLRAAATAAVVVVGSFGPAQATPARGSAPRASSAPGERFLVRTSGPTSLRDALFGTRTADQHFAGSPLVARYEIDAARGFVLERERDGALLKYENNAEIWALSAAPGPRGDVIYRNDLGEPVLRVARVGGVTLFSGANPGGVAVSLRGEAPVLRPNGMIGPDALIHALSVASARASRAAQHLVVFDAPDVAPAHDWVFADAAGLAAEAFVRTTVHAVAGRVAATRYLQVTFTPGHAPQVQSLGSVLQIVVAPERGVAGRPSSDRIYATMTRR